MFKTTANVVLPKACVHEQDVHSSRPMPRRQGDTKTPELVTVPPGVRFDGALLLKEWQAVDKRAQRRLDRLQANGSAIPAKEEPPPGPKKKGAVLTDQKKAELEDGPLRAGAAALRDQRRKGGK